jgi:SAM-dependent methyltransferase
MNLRGTKSRYKKDFIKYGASHKSLAWKSLGAQETRFKELLTDIDFSNPYFGEYTSSKPIRLLDMGCGMGDVIPKLAEKNVYIEYLGTDVVSEFLQVATDTYITRRGVSKKITTKFLNTDVIAKPLREKFDVVLCSGALNSNVSDADGYRKKAIKTLWNYAEYGLAFNMAGGFPKPKNISGSRIYYSDALKVLEYCITLTSKVIFRYHYRRRDFTIIMFR